MLQKLLFRLSYAVFSTYISFIVVSLNLDREMDEELQYTGPSTLSLLTDWKTSNLLFKNNREGKILITYLKCLSFLL